MKRFFLAALLLAGVTITVAQTTATNTATWSWSAPTQYTDGSAIPSTITVTYNLYLTTGGAGTEPSTPTVKGINSLNYVSSGYSAGQTVWGQVTAVANGLESAKSAEASKTFPLAAPAAVSLSVK